MTTYVVIFSYLYVYNVLMTDEEKLEFIRKTIEQQPLSYFNYLMSNKHSELRDFILAHSSFLDDKRDIKYNKPFNKATRIIYCLNSLTDFPQCCVCGEAIKRNLSIRENIHQLHCSNKCAQKDKLVVDKARRTKTLNHGDPNYNNVAQAKQTCKDRYGCESFF